MTPTVRHDAATLLPLAAGLLLLGLSAVISSPPVVGTLQVITFLGLGAVVRGNPWRTGAVGALPAIVAALVRAANDSAGSVLLVVLISVPAVALCGLLVKGGEVLVRRSDPDGARDAATVRTEPDDNRWRPFETKAQRGRFLVLVAVLALTGSWFLSNWGAEDIDRMATRRATEIRGALAGRTPESLRVDGITLGTEGGPQLPGGPYRSALLGADRFEATAEVGHRLQHRCIHVDLSPSGEVTTDIDKGRC